MSDWRRLLVSAALAGCATKPLRASAPPVAVESAVASVAASVVVPAPARVPVPRGKRLDAEDVLGRRLTAPLTLYTQALGAGGIRCEPRTFTPNPGGADFATSLVDATAYYLQAGMIQEHHFLLDRSALHGYSPDSLLVDGAEWFFSQDVCLARAGRYPPARVESAPGQRFDTKKLEAFFDRGARRVYQSSAVSAALFPSRPDFWYTLSSGGSFYAHVYWNAPVAWLEGPLDPAPAGAVHFAGAYSLLFGADYLEIGGLRLSEAPPWGQGAAQPVSPLLTGNPDRSAVVDFADDFWRHGPVYFLPLRDTTGVHCQEVSLTGERTLSYVAFGKRYDVALWRERAGFVFGIQRPQSADMYTFVAVTDLSPGGESHRAVVHGGGEDDFMIDGSPWFFSQTACEAGAPAAKPVNFRDFRRGEPSLAAEYYALTANARECQKLELENVNEGTGRMTTHGPAGSEQRVFDVYGEGGLTFWIGPPLEGTLDVAQKFRGRLVKPTPVSGGLRVDDAVWYESEATCKAHARRGGPPSRGTPAH